MVVEARKGDDGARDSIFVYRGEIEIVPVDQSRSRWRLAWRRFGKGRHPASLNRGDCFAYALAGSGAAPLLRALTSLRLTSRPRSRTLVSQGGQPDRTQTALPPITASDPSFHLDGSSQPTIEPR
jgi:hypothetical protein